VRWFGLLRFLTLDVVKMPYIKASYLLAVPMQGKVHRSCAAWHSLSLGFWHQDIPDTVYCWLMRTAESWVSSCDVMWHVAYCSFLAVRFYEANVTRLRIFPLKLTHIMQSLDCTVFKSEGFPRWDGGFIVIQDRTFVKHCSEVYFQLHEIRMSEPLILCENSIFTHIWN
jgi:hypothetical protein